MECPSCLYVSVPGESPVDGSCANCGQRPEPDQPSGTPGDFNAFGMPAPGEDDGNQGNPLAEGVIMGDDGERQPSARDNYMGSVQPPLWYAASEVPEDPDIPMDLVDVLEADDVPEKRKDRDLDSVKASLKKHALFGSLMQIGGSLAGGALGTVLGPEGTVLGAAAGRAVGGALGRSVGNGIDNKLQGGGQQPGAPQAAPQTVEDPSFYASLHRQLVAGDDNPAGNNSVPHDSEDGDSEEHQDGDRALSLQTDDAAGEGGAGADQAHGFSEHALGHLALMLPLLMHYHNNPGGDQDPMVHALDQVLEAEQPGYKDTHVDPQAHQKIIMFFQNGGKHPAGDEGEADETKTAAELPAPSQVDHPVNFDRFDDTAVMKCPDCQGRQCVDRYGQAVPCNTCGDYMGIPARGEQSFTPDDLFPTQMTHQPMDTQGLTPAYGGIHDALVREALQQPGLSPVPNTVMHPDEQMAANPTAQTPCPTCGTPTALGQPCPECSGHYGSRTASGPQTDEQKAAVAQLLLDSGRQDEIPEMLQHPENYAKELTQITGQQEPPPAPDPSQQPPPPPPAGGGMQPGMTAPAGAPQMGMTSAIEKWAEDHVEKHHDNFDNQIDVDAADVTHPEDLQMEQDSGHTWLDDSGQPLKVGQEYEMFSNKYDIPDMIRIEAVKPDSVEYTLTGEYGLEHRTEISHEEAQLEGLSFTPTSATHPDGPDQVAGEGPTSGPTPGMEQTDLSGGAGKGTATFASHNPKLDWLKEGGAKFTPMEQREFIEEAGVARNADKLDLSGTHYESSRAVEVDPDYFLFGL